ncbi:MAG: hypothetical protein IPK82_19115 [Polyangiaceae bacterium]|nr:hypothetical protein [Polyangiaceae bacterium]
MNHKPVFCLVALVAAFAAACTNLPIAPGPSDLSELDPDEPSFSDDAATSPGDAASRRPVYTPIFNPHGSAFSPPILAAKTENGNTAVVNGTSGEILAQVQGSGWGGDVDMAWDPWGTRLFVLEASPSEEGAELVSSTVVLGKGQTPPLLSPPKHEVWVSGIARLATSPFGPVIFENSYSGPRWRLVSEGKFVPSVFGAEPRSFTTYPTNSGALTIDALTYGAFDDALEIRSSTVDETGLSTPIASPFNLAPPNVPPSVRAVWKGGLPILIAVFGSSILVSNPSHSKWVGLSVDDPLETLVQAELLGEGNTILATATGDADVVAVHLDDDGQVECASTLDLPGHLTPSNHFFARTVVPAGAHSAFVGTSQGVFKIKALNSCPLTLQVDTAFSGSELRPPIAAP